MEKTYEEEYRIFLSVIMIMLSCSNNIYAENVKYGANDIVYEQNYVFSDGRLTDVKDENGIDIEHNEYENGMRVYKEGNSICQFVYDSKKNLLYENRNGTQIQYIYDYNEQGKYYLINGFIVDGNKYNYLRNEENKIEGIYDDNDNLLAKYKYNGNTLTQVLKSNNGVWSECNDEEFIGNYNKIRNVFAYYDDETKLYYENGCFYDSITNKSIRELNSEIGIATCSYEYDGDMYDGYGKIHEVWIAGYGYVDSIDELYYIIDDYFDRNIFYDYDRS